MKVLAVAAVIAALASVLSACASGQVPRPSQEHLRAARERWPDMEPGSLERGRELYVARCGGCHNLYPPKSIPAAQWTEIVDRMSGRAGMAAEEARLVLCYLVTVASP